MKNSLLVFGTKNFNNSLNEIKKYLDFSLSFYNNDGLSNYKISSINALLIDGQFCNNERNLRLINGIENKPILLIEKQEFLKKCNYTDKIVYPFTLSDFNLKIITLISAKKFNQNSSIQIKDYLIDKNEKKLKKNNLVITITEREIQIIELLFSEKIPLSKNILLKKIWKYSKDADTHTVETHVYRLRRKILVKFNDDKFIINSKAGYSI
jgi:hypothetical protein